MFPRNLQCVIVINEIPQEFCIALHCKKTLLYEREQVLCNLSKI